MELARWLSPQIPARTMLQMPYVVLVVAALVVIALVLALVRLGKSDFSLLANRMARKSRETFEVLKPCPLCNTMLRRGETVHSVVFSGGDAASSRQDDGRPRDYLAHIFGCPYCYPANAEHVRRCPVCRKDLSADGFVVARMFDKPGRKHVHVLGCGRCRRSSAPK